MSLIKRLVRHAVQHPYGIALEGHGERFTYSALMDSVRTLSAHLVDAGIGTLALALDNGPNWALLDLAALSAGIPVVPLPGFFSATQRAHVLADAGVDAVVTATPDAFENPHSVQSLRIPGGATLSLLRFSVGRRRIPPDIAKLTYTSGTTGQPKGVMLAWPQIEAVVRGLAEAGSVQSGDRLLALNPLGVLLENIASVYVGLWAGATAVLPGMADTGLQGASGSDGDRMHRLLEAERASAAVFMPQTLLALVEALERGCAGLPQLRFAAVGGAPLAPRLLERAAAVGLPVYQGYGMSECASVMTLNRPGANRPGSVGRPMPHLTLRIADDGEVQVARAVVASYLDEDDIVGDTFWWGTGDLGHFDADGYLYLEGRRRDCFITAYGRNVSPAWVEHELSLEPEIAQAAVFGEARPFNVAVLKPVDGCDPDQLAAAVRRVNAVLPDYARIARWFTATVPFTSSNGLLTGTGRIRRNAINAIYRDALDALYLKELNA